MSPTCGHGRRVFHHAWFGWVHFDGKGRGRGIDGCDRPPLPHQMESVVWTVERLPEHPSRCVHCGGLRPDHRPGCDYREGQTV